MGLSKDEKLVLERLGKEEIRVIPEDLTGKFTPEMLQFTLAQLQAKGLVEYMEGAYMPTEKAQKLFKKKEIMREGIIACGHPRITATHKTIIEITKEDGITENGDSIIAVKANKSCRDLKSDFKNYLKLGKRVKMTISADGIEDEIRGFGSPALTLTNEKSIIIRKSDFIDDRTMLILADKAGCDLKKGLIKKLKNPKTRIRFILEG